jgi:hypothetical protein
MMKGHQFRENSNHLPYKVVTSDIDKYDGLISFNLDVPKT